MSILVVEVLSEGIIFGADRNITYTDDNGSTTQGTSRSKVFRWPTERFLFGFVGAATVGGLPMDEWLDSLKDEFANKTSLEEIAQELHQKLQLQRIIRSRTAGSLETITLTRRARDSETASPVAKWRKILSVVCKPFTI